MSYVRALLNNAAVADNMSRMGLADSRECVCGRSLETVEHVLMECSIESVGRNQMIAEIGELWMNKKKAGGLQVSLDLLLYPFGNPKLNHTDCLQVMGSVFNFLRNMSRKF